MAAPYMQYNFPELSIPEIVHQFNLVFPELGVDEQDFRGRKGERWQHVYSTVVHYMFDATVDQLAQIPLGHEYSPHLEIYEGIDHILTLGKAMQKIMQTCGVFDFSMKDVVTPSRKRLIKIMSGLINFVHFRNQRMEVYEAIIEEENDKQSQIEVFSHENDEVMRKINQIMSTRAEQESIIKIEDENAETLRQQLQSLQVDVVNKKKNLADEKSVHAEKTFKVAEINEKVASLKEEISKLDGMIVENPERMQADMENMQKDIERLEGEKEQCRSRLIELQDQLEAKCAVNEECEHAIKHMDAVIEETSKFKTCQLVLNKLEDEVQEKKEKLRELDAQEGTLRRGLTSKQEKLSKITMQQEYKVKDLKQTIEAISSDQKMKSRVHQKEDAEAEAIQAQTRSLVLENQDRQKQFEIMMKCRLERLSELEEAVELYHVTLGDTWKNVREKLKNVSIKECRSD